MLGVTQLLEVLSHGSEEPIYIMANTVIFDNLVTQRARVSVAGVFTLCHGYIMGPTGKLLEYICKYLLFKNS